MCTTTFTRHPLKLSVGAAAAPAPGAPEVVVMKSPPPRQQQEAVCCRRRRREKKTISFQSTVAIKLISTHHEMTDSEYYATYHTPDDYDDIKHGVLDDIKCLRSNAIEGANVRSYRGIEHLKTTTSSKARKLRRQIIVEAVLSEQDLQREQGHRDDNTIAKVASDLSIYSKVEASEKADKDAEETLALFHLSRTHMSQKGRAATARSTGMGASALMNPVLGSSINSRRPSAAVA